MGNQVLLIGCAAAIADDLRRLQGHPLLHITALPDLRRPHLPDTVRQADLVVLHQAAAPRDLPAVCRHLRGQTRRPLLVVLSHLCEALVAEVLDAGADDALSAAASPRELWSRLRAQLRRDQEYAVAERPSALELGDLWIDSGRHEVTVRGQPVVLTPREFGLLEYLARRAGQAVPRQAILEEVWRYNDEMTTRTLDVHVGRLRQKIERNHRTPELIVTVPGVGYKLAAG